MNKQELFESLDQDNNSGIATDNLVKIVEADQAGEWEELTFDEMLAEMDAMEAAYDAKHNL